MLTRKADSAVALESIPFSGVGWTLAEAGSADAINVQVPGCVHTDLRAAGKIPDPFYRDNESKLQWISERTWVYARHFALTPETLMKSHIELRCDGLETFAHIDLNGQRVGNTDNMFRVWTFDVKPLLHVGDNELCITFDPISVIQQQKRGAAKGAAAGSFIDGIGEVRVEPCSGGWDFGPKFITAGIWRPISLVAWDDGRIASVSTTQDLTDAAKACVTVTVSARSERAERLGVHASVSLNGRLIDSKTFGVAADGGAVGELKIPDPQLWWPSGMGEQPLYDLTIELTSSGVPIDREIKRIGLRSIELLPKTSTRPLTLTVNRVPIFAKGASFVPADIFPTNAMPTRLRGLVTAAKSANMNMLRCWGGGYYEDDAFYDACDEAGILVWFDFKFACSAYPVNDPAWLTTTRAEFEDQIRRLSDHASIAVWCGNNEVEALVHTYGTMRQVDYDKLFHDVLPNVLTRLAPDAQYVGGSPEAGDEHNWSVWHMGAPFENYRLSRGWMTEFGFQSFPEPRTVASYTNEQDRASLQSPVMQAHQHNGNGRGNEMIQQMMDRYFLPPKDADAALWLSQINQAMGLTLGVRHWRGDWPRSSGALVWQFNDVWPGPTWSIIDYFGRPKASIYQLRRAFADVALDAEADVRSGEVALHVVSDRRQPFEALVRWRLTDLSGKQLRSGDAEVHVPVGVVSVSTTLPNFAADLQEAGRRNAVLWIELEIDQQVVATQSVIFTKPKNLRLRDPNLSHETKRNADGSFDVVLKAEQPALDAWLTLDIDAELSDNFFDLHPDRFVAVHVVPSEAMSLEAFEKRLKVRSLYDLCDYANANSAATIIAPSNDGSLILTAASAEIIGDTATLEAGSPPNIGRWNDARDSIEWRVHVDRPGRYNLRATTAQPLASEQKRTFTVTLGDQHLTALLPVTNSWTDYNEATLGALEIKQAGDYTVTLHPDSIAAGPTAGGALMNFRSLSLRPASIP